MNSDEPDLTTREFPFPSIRDSDEDRSRIDWRMFVSSTVQRDWSQLDHATRLAIYIEANERCRVMASRTIDDAWPEPTADNTSPSAKILEWWAKVQALGVNLASSPKE